MDKFKVTKTAINDLLIIEPKIYTDSRGSFAEVYNQKDFQDLNINDEFIQDNYSKSFQGVLRGLHYQEEFPQAKLIRAVYGSVFDVALDLRKNSETFGKAFGVILSRENGKIFYIPKEFAHGYLVLTPEADLHYKVSQFYYAHDEKGVFWNDPDININWPLQEYNIQTPIMKQDDLELPKLKEISTFH